MIYAALASVVADIRRRRLRSMLPFLAQDFVAHSEIFEDKMNGKEFDVQLNQNDMEALTMVAFAYFCLASLLTTSRSVTRHSDTPPTPHL